jgi:hypothetical protein
VPPDPGDLTPFREDVAARARPTGGEPVLGVVLVVVLV